MKFPAKWIAVSMVTLTFAIAGHSASADAVAKGLPSSITSKRMITYCAAISQPPFELFNAQQQPEGVDIELGDLMAAKLGVKARWVNIPFAELIPALIAGHCDAVISGLYIKPERLKVIDQIPYRYAMEGVLLKSGAAKLAGLEALSGEKVATVTGTTANVLLQQANASLAKAGKKPIDIVAFPDNTPALQQVQFGQVKGYALAYETAVYYDQISPGQFELGVPPFYKMPIGIGVRKGDPAFETALNTALVGIEKNSSYAAVFKKWSISFDMLGS